MILKGDIMKFIDGVFLIEEIFTTPTWAIVVLFLGVILGSVFLCISLDTFDNRFSCIGLVILFLTLIFCFVCAFKFNEPTGTYKVRVVEHLVDWEEFKSTYEILDYCNGVYEIKIKE